MKLKSILLLFSAIGFASVSQALSFDFLQTGYDEGAFVVGTFSGEDANNDSVLFLDELSGFDMIWSGNSLVPAFSMSLGNLLAFSYELGGPLLGDVLFEGIISFNGAAYLGGVGALELVFPGSSTSGLTGAVLIPDVSVSATREAILVAPRNVPDNGSTVLLGMLGVLSFAAASTMGRRKSTV